MGNRGERERGEMGKKEGKEVEKGIKT